MVGYVTHDGVPIVVLNIAGQERTAIVDTGFNGDLELPESLLGKLSEQPAGRVIEEDAYVVDFPFDGRSISAIATFVPDRHILLGTNLLRDYRLQIGFASKTLRLERE